MYSICTVFVRFRSVHILYIYCTYTVQRAERVLEIKVLRVLFLAVSARVWVAEGGGEWLLGSAQIVGMRLLGRAVGVGEWLLGPVQMVGMRLLWWGGGLGSCRWGRVVGGGMLTSWLFLGSEIGLNGCGTARKTRFCCFCVFFACFLDFSSLAVRFLRPVRGFGGLQSNFFFVRNGLLSSRCWKIF